MSDSPGSLRTILVADDRPEIRLLTASLLEEEGYAALAAGDAEEALRIAAKAPIDLALLDVVMPGSRVDDLVAGLRSLHPEAGVVLMSGYFSELLARSGRLGPRSALLAKPFTRAQLLRAVESALGPA